MLDPDARSWALNGTEMTAVELGWRGKCLQEMTDWLDEHTVGDYVSTPTYVFFEHATEATLFKLGFNK